MLGLGLSLPRRVAFGRRTWTPAALFAQGQQGVWYEPKPEYLFQDSAGTTPVTADGQPVGLMLDRHLGLVLGPELVTNGTFDTDLSGWVAGVWQYDTGVALHEPTANSFDYIEQSGILADGVWYLIEIEVIEIDGGRIGFSGNSFVIRPEFFTVGSHSAVVQGAGQNLRIYAPGENRIAIDNVSVRQLPGNHVSQSSASLKPLYAITPDQLDFDEFDDVLPVTFPVDMGSDVTIGRAVPGVGGEILTGQTVGTSYDITQDMAAMIIVNETPSADNLSKLQAYLDTMAGV